MDPALPTGVDGWDRVVLAGVALAVGAGLVLRFWTRSDLWLDEALTVNIARLPLSQIPHALRQDGSPPVYYFLLHFWMRLFGTGNEAVRSLSGVLGVFSLPLTFLAGRRLGGRIVGAVALVLVATSPFAVRYSTENRMYMLLVDLSLLGYLALDSALRRPTKPRLAVVALVSGLLVETHYWSFYLLGAVVLMLAWMGRPGRDRGEAALVHAARVCLVTVVAGLVLLVPWATTLVFQLRHTGTPWSTPANFSAMVNAVSDFAGGATNQGRALGLLFFALGGLGLFGIGRDALHIDLDLRTRPEGRGVAWVALATLFLGIVIGYVVGSAYTARYTAVMFALFILLVALGVTRLVDRRMAYGVTAACMAFGFVGSVPNISVDRTQAGQISRAIEARAAPGDLVVYCPDQLGPAMSRLLPAGRYVQTTYPRHLPPQRVDWVDYAKVNESSRPAPFASRLVAEAGSAHSIWLVWSPDYLTFQGKCSGLEAHLAALRPHSKAILLENPALYFEHANLVRYWPS